MQRRIHENSLANLNRFQPGQSGNPGGRPKGTPSIGHAYARLLALSPAERAAYTPKDGAEEIALAQIKEAIAGEVRAAKEITDRTDGPVERRVVIENPAQFRSQLHQAWAFWCQMRENMHQRLCEAACICLTDEQIKLAVLAGYPEQARGAAEAELLRITG